MFKIIALIILGFIPAIACGEFIESAFGNFSEITNYVSAEANTGGNTAENGGSVIKGEAEASVEIKTENSGEEIENIEVKIESDGEVKEFTKEETKISENGNTKVETKIELKVNGEASSSNKTNLSPKNQAQAQNINNLVASIIKTVFKSIKNFFSWLG